MSMFAAQIANFTRTANSKVAAVDLEFKKLFALEVVTGTRIAQPLLWVRPDPNHVPGTLRGNWRMGSTRYQYSFRADLKNRTNMVPARELNKIRALKPLYLTNRTPYAPVYEELDGMLAGAIARSPALMQLAVRNVKNRKQS